MISIRALNRRVHYECLRPYFLVAPAVNNGHPVVLSSLRWVRAARSATASEADHIEDVKDMATQTNVGKRDCHTFPLCLEFFCSST